MTALGLGPQDLLIALARALAVITLFVAFGTLLVRVAVAPAPAPAAARALGALQGAALAAAALAALLWTMLETAAMAGTTGFGATFAALPLVASQTAFGHLQMARLGLLALTALALAARARRVAALLAGLAVLLEAGMLHAAAMHAGPSLLLASEALHVLAAAAWLGALPALAIVVARSAPEAAAVAARRLSGIGIAAVAALAVSASVQAWRLVGTWADLVATDYGRVALAKLLLFVLLVALAARNRRRLVPHVAGGDPTARARLRRSIVAAAVLGVAVLTLAALLSTMAPAMDMTAP